MFFFVVAIAFAGWTSPISASTQKGTRQCLEILDAVIRSSLDPEINVIREQIAVGNKRNGLAHYAHRLTNRILGGGSSGRPNQIARAWLPDGATESQIQLVRHLLRTTVNRKLRGDLTPTNESEAGFRTQAHLDALYEARPSELILVQPGLGGPQTQGKLIHLLNRQENYQPSWPRVLLPDPDFDVEVTTDWIPQATSMVWLPDDPNEKLFFSLSPQTRRFHLLGTLPFFAQRIPYLIQALPKIQPEVPGEAYRSYAFVLNPKALFFILSNVEESKRSMVYESLVMANEVKFPMYSLEELNKLDTDVQQALLKHFTQNLVGEGFQLDSQADPLTFSFVRSEGNPERIQIEFASQ